MADIKIVCKCGQSFTFTDKDQKFYKEKGFPNPKKCKACRQKKQNHREKTNLDDAKEWGTCESCGTETFLVGEVGLCGPCCFGEADTINGNW